VLQGGTPLNEFSHYQYDADTNSLMWFYNDVICTKVFDNGVWAEVVKPAEKEIDFSKAGRLVTYNDTVILTTGVGTTDNYISFSGTVISSSLWDEGHHSGTWDAKVFKLYTGEPITLSNAK